MGTAFREQTVTVSSSDIRDLASKYFGARILLMASADFDILQYLCVSLIYICVYGKTYHTLYTSLCKSSWLPKYIPRGDPGWGLLMELPGNE